MGKKDFFVGGFFFIHSSNMLAKKLLHHRFLVQNDLKSYPTLFPPSTHQPHWLALGRVCTRQIGQKNNQM
jgi:hypothetical protein